MFPRTPPLSIALAGLEPETVGLARGRNGVAGGDGGDDVRVMIDWARGRGFAAVQLSAAMPGVRPRELDRSGRRGLAALLRRTGLELSGLDQWIPAEHFRTPETADRAVSAVLAAIEMAADLSTLGAASAGARVPVSMVLAPETPADVVATVAARAERSGVRVADHAWPARVVEPEGWLGVGLDPAAALAAGADPGAAVSSLGGRLASARLTDVARGLGGTRVAPGSRGGTLDVLGYQVALATGGYARPAVLDLRGVRDQGEAAPAALSAWTGSVV